MSAPTNADTVDLELEGEPLDGWRRHAACADLDRDRLFYGDDDQRAEAKRVCRERCPVRSWCLEYALTVGDYTRSVWGGLDGDQRLALVRYGRATRRSA